MKYKILGWLLSLGLLLTACGKEEGDGPGDGSVVPVPDRQGMTVKGRVGDTQGQAIAGVPVTDGVHFTVTNEEGVYYLPTDFGKSKFVYLTLPADYEISHRYSVPQFYQALEGGNAVNRKDFTLKKREVTSNRYTLLVMADPQIRKTSVDESVHILENATVADMNAFKSASAVPCYGLCLGDIVWDEMSLFSVYQNKIAPLNMPVFHVIGNHDHVKEIPLDYESSSKYEEAFGPVNYSVNIGKIHYILLDNVIYKGSKTYDEGLTEEQLEWLRQDLAYVEKGATVVMAMHIPLARHYTTYTWQNKAKLLELLKDYRVHVFAGHAHYHDHYIFDDTGMNVHTCARTGGAIWINGEVCRDGTPSGYTVVEADGDQLTWQYKAIGKDLNYQLRTYRPGEAKAGYVVANIWGYDTEWKSVEWWENGTKAKDMERSALKDPVFVSEYEAHSGNKEEPLAAWHMFQVMPSAGITAGEVVATDRFGNTYRQSVRW